MMSRIVCWFSCGAASAVATKLMLSNNREDIVIARCVVKEEHPDNDRFAADCEKWFGMPITNLTSEKYSGSVYNVIEKRQYVSGKDGAPCTGLLKKEVRIAFSRPTDTHVFGYCAEEQNRWDKFLDANNIDAIAPLIERGLEHKDCLSMVKTAGIELPDMYKLGYHHNNCIGCVKASGAGYWNKVRIDFPYEFDRMAKVSKAIGCRLTREGETRIFLDELKPGTGDYQKEPEIQCGVFCEMAEKEYAPERPKRVQGILA